MTYHNQLPSWELTIFYVELKNDTQKYYIKEVWYVTGRM